MSAELFAMFFMGCYFIIGLSILLAVGITFYLIVRMRKEQADFMEVIFGPDESEDDQWKRPS